MGILVREPRIKVLVIIACAFVATALAFLGAAVASFAVSSDIDRQTSSMLENALPSVRDLARARTALRRLHQSASENALAPPPRSAAALTVRWNEFKGALEHEMGTPWYPGEHELFDREVEPAIAQLRFALDDIQKVADAPRGDPALHAATERLLDAVGGADVAVADLSELNHDQAFAAAKNIVHNRREAARVSLYLDVGATIVAAIAAALAIWFTAYASRLLRRALALETHRADELDVFAQRVAHDLMSPLSVVSLAIGRARRRPADAATPHALERAERALLRSRRMVDGIYAFAQASRAEPSPEATSPLREAVLDAASALQGTDGDGCPTIDVQAVENVQVRMERGMVDTVLSNLLSNASKYMVGAPVRRVTVRAGATDGDRVHVEVEDTGPGVPDGMSGAVFDAYKRGGRSPQAGLGLGLATVKRLVLAHGGAVGVRNGASGGAVFWFDLPLAGRPQGAAEAEVAPPMRVQLRPTGR